MKTFVQSLLFTSLIVLTFSCQSADDKLAFSSQRNLDEADLLIERREFKVAQEMAEEARRNLALLVSKASDNADYRLLQARANLTLFLAKNIRTIEKANMESGSLVRLPDSNQYEDFDRLLIPTVQLLESTLTMPDLSFSQIASIHTILASIYRLHRSSLGKALLEYDEAIQTNRTWLHNLKEEQKDHQPRAFSIARVKNQITDLMMAKVEVSLLAERWQESLGILEEIMGSDDLEYFDIRLSALQQRVDEIQYQLQEQFTDPRNARAGRIKQFIHEQRIHRGGALNEMGGYSPQEAALLQAEIALTETKNNLIYRMLCYYHLDDFIQLEHARKVMRKHYPEIESRVMHLLEVNASPNKG